jgi:hypothetical protein
VGSVSRSGTSSSLKAIRGRFDSNRAHPAPYNLIVWHNEHRLNLFADKVETFENAVDFLEVFRIGFERWVAREF